MTDERSNEMEPMEEETKEKLIEELEKEPDHALSPEQLERVARMVNEYKTKIKSHLTDVQEKRTRWSDRLADQIASFGGSWTFIILFLTFLMFWMSWNYLMTNYRFDEPPFILLNLMLSCLAAFQAPVILMSQNRQAERDNQEALLSFAINYKAEQENLELDRRLRRIEAHLEQLTKLCSDRNGEGKHNTHDDTTTL